MACLPFYLFKAGIVVGMLYDLAEFQKRKKKFFHKKIQTKQKGVEKGIQISIVVLFLNWMKIVPNDVILLTNKKQHFLSAEYLFLILNFCSQENSSLILLCRFASKQKCCCDSHLRRRFLPLGLGSQHLLLQKNFF
jgi:hypothetical protein